MQVFGRRKVFMDVENIPAGENFRSYVEKQVAACHVMLVIIGQNWLNVSNDAGDRRLDQPDDVVAFEISTALAASYIRVIPVLIDGARMPKANELPESLKPLAHRAAIEFRNAYFEPDTVTLLVARVTRTEGTVFSA